MFLFCLVFAMSLCASVYNLFCNATMDRGWLVRFQHICNT